MATNENAVEITVVSAPLSEQSERVLAGGIRLLREQLTRYLPQFDWSIALQRDVQSRGRAVMGRLAQGVSLRDRERQDFVMVLDGQLFQGTDHQDVVCASSRAAGVALLSLEPIENQHVRTEPEWAEELLANLLAALLLRLLGDEPPLVELVRRFRRGHQGPDGDEQPDPTTHEPLVAERLAEHRDFLRQALVEVADLRLEEHPRAGQQLGMSVRAVAMNFSPILQNARTARPWMMPFRLRTLTTASVSAMLILMMTAEVWDLALQQSTTTVVAVAGCVVGVMSAAIWRGQVMSHRGPLTEQIITTNASLGLVVGLGVVVTYALLYLTVLALGSLLFSDDLVQAWAPTLGREVTLVDKLRHAGLLAAIGLGVGSLGASLEGIERLRSIVYVDEELA